MPMRPCLSFLLLICLLVAGPAHAQDQAFETKAQQAFMIDGETGTVLFAKNETVAVPPASLAKLMAMETVFASLKDGSLSLTTTFPVSEYAWRTGGAPSGTATMFAALKSEIAVSDLLRGAIVQLANDACIILAEGIDGSESAFAERMTRRARTLGLKTANFVNATGLPSPDNRITMREAVLLARQIQSTYPDFYRIYAEPDFEWNKIAQRNRNPLIAAGLGVDGLATGFAEGHGFSFVTSMQKDGRRVFLAMAGLSSEKERLEEARRTLDWAMTAFTQKRLFETGAVIADVPLYGADRPSVPVAAAGPVDVLVPANSRERLSARVVYRWPIALPLTSGTVVGTLKVASGDTVLREVPLTASEGAQTGTISSRALDALQELLFFWL